MTPETVNDQVAADRLQPVVRQMDAKTRSDPSESGRREDMTSTTDVNPAPVDRLVRRGERAMFDDKTIDKLINLYNRMNAASRPKVHPHPLSIRVLILALFWSAQLAVVLGIPYWFNLSEAMRFAINVTMGSLGMLWTLSYLDSYRLGDRYGVGYHGAISHSSDVSSGVPSERHLPGALHCFKNYVQKFAKKIAKL